MTNNKTILQIEDIILYLFCSIHDSITDYKHPKSKLYKSEVILVGVLFVLKGISFRRYYNWLYQQNLFPSIPERSRLQRLIIIYSYECNNFLSKETFFNVMDSFGIELIHPVREIQSHNKELYKKGLSNYRWIVGRKLNVVINGNLEICNIQDKTANVKDCTFNHKSCRLDCIYLTDSNYRERNKVHLIKSCNKGKWSERMAIERLFSLWSCICNMKKSMHKTITGFKSKCRYLSTLTNLIFRINQKIGFNKMSMAQWTI